jgi:hypothetical protein
MAVTAQGPSAQGLAGLGMGSQPGASSPAFQAPDGTEQFFGIPQAYGSQAPIWPPPGLCGAATVWHVEALWPATVDPGAGRLQRVGAVRVHPAERRPGPAAAGSAAHRPFVGQILPVAQQMILPQVIALAVQMVQQLIAQAATAQLTGQPFWAPQAATPFVPGLRPVPACSKGRT